MFEIGIDIEEISRFTKIQYKNKKSFYKRIFTEDEIKYCLSKSNPYPHFAVRFCAKEAAIKALNIKKIKVHDIEIKMIKNKPTILLPNDRKGKVSLSHSINYAIAIVMIYDE